MQPSKIKYIYILSQRYSGSTLLSFLLATHPEVSTIGERRKFFIKSLNPDGKGNQNCSCGQNFKDCAYWNKIKNRLLPKLPKTALDNNFTEFQLSKNKYYNQVLTKFYEYAISRQIPLNYLPFSSQVKRLCHFNHLLIKEILEIDETSVFLDSSKTMSNLLYLSLIPEIDLRIIWLVRDPRAQVNSALKYNKWTIEEAAKNWVKEMKLNEKVMGEWRPNYLKMRYEDLCRAPEDEMNDIFNFIGIDPTQFSLNFRAEVQHIMGNTSMRLGRETKIEERKDWLEKLTQPEIEIIEHITHGYSNFYS